MSLTRDVRAHYPVIKIMAWSKELNIRTRNTLRDLNTKLVYGDFWLKNSPGIFIAEYFKKTQEQAAESSVMLSNTEQKLQTVESAPITNNGLTSLGVTTGQEGHPDKASLAEKGGIDLNSANLDLQIKRDGRGVPLPLAQQDMAQLSRIQGFVPEIIEIKPAVNLPIISELQQKLQSAGT